MEVAVSGFARGLAFVALAFVGVTALAGACAAEGWGIPLFRNVGGGFMQHVGKGGFMTGLITGAQTGLAALFSGGPGLAAMATGGAVGSLIAMRNNKKDLAVAEVINQNLELREALQREQAMERARNVNVQMNEPAASAPAPAAIIPATSASPSQEQYVNVHVNEPQHRHADQHACRCNNGYVAEEARREANSEICALRGNPYA